MMRPLAALVSCLIPLFVQAQDAVSLSGTITDAASGETLIGATISLPTRNEGTTSNEYGFYALTLPPTPDTLLVEFRYIGYQPQTFFWVPLKDSVLNVALSEGVELEEVVVKADPVEEQFRSAQMSVEALSTREVKVIPALLGETDILRVLQLKPGIPSGAEGTTGLYVRGGNTDQNLIILDEAVVYNPNHLFGFFSTFNTDAVKDLKMYKGGFPAQYGGRLSSVIDVRMKEGNNRSFSGAGGIGLITSRLTLEGPLQKERSSFIVSGRRTYVDLITRRINKAKEDDPDYEPIPDYFFYDLNAKVNYQLGERDRLFLSGYFGRDAFGFEGDFFDFSFNWGNATGTARWNHVFSSRLFANTTFTYSDYEYNIETKVTGFSFNIGSDVRDINLKSDFYFAAGAGHTLRFGGNVTHHQFDVGRLQAGSDDGTVSFSAGDRFDGVQFAAYIGDEWKPDERWNLNGGLRFSGFYNDGHWFAGIEPRLAARYSLNERLALKASYAHMRQYVHLVSTSGVALPTDIWYPSTARVKPQFSHQVALGASFLLGKDFILTNEYYYKRLGRQVDFVDWAQLFVNEDLEGEFAIGKGYAYGMELGIEKKVGDLTGWIGYTLAWVRRGKFQPVDPERFYSSAEVYTPPRFDRRHDLSVVLMYQLNRRWSFTGTAIYGSGDLTWVPVGRFAFQDIQGGQLELIVPDFGEERNNLRLPYFLRFDFGVVYRLFPKWGQSDLTLNFFNVTNRRNAFFIYLEPEFETFNQGPFQADIPVGVKAKQVSLFPILGALTWNFKF